MKKATATACSFLLFAAMVFSCCLISFANQQTQDIEKTRLSDTDTYYSFDASTKTLTISGEGSTPDMSNNSITQP